MWNPFAYFKLPEDFPSFLKSQFTPLPYPSFDFSGQTIIVTGSNVGLGLEAARHFVRLNANKVILACRNQEKGQAAKSDIERSTQRKNVVDVWELDLSSFKSVRLFCQRASSQLERIDVVVENAGLATPSYTEHEEMESTITVNVVSTFLVALLLLPKLRAGGLKYNTTPRLAIVSSEAHEQATFAERFESSIFTALKNPRYMPDRYNTSKLLELLFVRELALAMTPSGKKPPVIINALTPGFCDSELMRNANFPLNFLAWLAKIFIGRTTEMGSRTLVAAAAAGQETHGQYMVDCIVREPSRWVRSEDGKETQKRVFYELCDYLESVEKGIMGNL